MGLVKLSSFMLKLSAFLLSMAGSLSSTGILLLTMAVWGSLEAKRSVNDTNTPVAFRITTITPINNIAQKTPIIISSLTLMLDLPSIISTCLVEGALIVVGLKELFLLCVAVLSLLETLL